MRPAVGCNFNTVRETNELEAVQLLIHELIHEPVACISKLQATSYYHITLTSEVVASARPFHVEKLFRHVERSTVNPST